MERQLIKGATRLVALLGNPVGHSISPLIHNHGFSKCNLNYAYVPLGFEKKDLPAIIDTMRGCNFAGANVTIPYKSDVLTYCDELTEISQVSGTVNTLYFNDNKLMGTTTDGEGFFAALEKGGHSVDNGTVLILGNGGTARTLAFALALKQNGCRIAIAGRSLEKVKVLTDEIFSKTSVVIGPLTIGTSEFYDYGKKCSLVVNCTPLGMSPHTDASPVERDFFTPQMFVFDAIYNPSETRLLREAREAGCKTMNGLLMLLYQGLASFTYWTGQSIDDSLFDISELEQLIQ